MPSKKIFLIALACIVAVGTIIFAKDYNTTAQIENTESIGVIEEPNTSTNEDWRDSLDRWTGEGEENSILGADEQINNEDFDVLYDSIDPDLPATDQLAQMFFTEYLQLKQSGQTVDESQAEIIVAQLLDSEVIKEYEAKLFNLSDLQISTDDSAGSIRDYGNHVGAILLQNTPQTSTNEIEIIEKFAQTQNENTLSELKVFSEAYRNITNSLLEVEVPPSAAEIHLNFSNSALLVATDLEGIVSLNNDPILAILGLGNYEQSVNKLTTSYKDLQSYFLLKEITFSEEEAGYTLR